MLSVCLSMFVRLLFFVLYPFQVLNRMAEFDEHLYNNYVVQRHHNTLRLLISDNK
jgi:hypothetical protein